MLIFRSAGTSPTLRTCARARLPAKASSRVAVSVIIYLMVCLNKREKSGAKILFFADRTKFFVSLQSRRRWKRVFKTNILNGLQ
jgi:hypothetical protein